MKIYHLFLIGIFAFAISCNTQEKKEIRNPDEAFASFETRFLDRYWKQYPSSGSSSYDGNVNSIQVGYGKYYEDLVIPDSAAFAAHIQFSRNWLDSLSKVDTAGLSDNNKISLNIIKNQLESDIWYQADFKLQEWDAAFYNLSNESFYIINQPYAPLADRLRILSKHLENADKYYKAAFKMLNRPTRESVSLAIMQNEGGISIFGKDLADSVISSRLSTQEIDILNKNVSKTVAAIRSYIDSLKKIQSDKSYTFRKFNIGKDRFREKFKYDLAIDFSPEELYEKALAEKRVIYEKMYTTANNLWSKYFGQKSKPTDSLVLVKSVIDAISLQHAKPTDFFDTLKNQVYKLKHFIIEKDLFAFDTTYPIVVRLMPAYERGFALASAEFTPPYQKKGDTYYNIDDVTQYSKEKQESALREINNYYSQLLSMHEAMPGHCLQGIYNNLKSPDVLRSVFQNGAMIEGWAVYTEGMMLENGWNNTSEMKIIQEKLKLRELGNVIIDYQMQCLDSPKESIIHLLVNELFQTQAQAEEKYKRATLSQVQLCSYYAGSSAIFSLRDEYKVKKGNAYSLKEFHENFLGYGSSPVKYIRERMLQ